MGSTFEARCYVCGSGFDPYFRKRFDTLGLTEVQYCVCRGCGLGISSTHYQMSNEAWSELNRRYHLSFIKSSYNPDDPDWLDRIARQQRKITEFAEHCALLNNGPWLDYAAGGGQLADGLSSRGLPTHKFDAYLPAEGERWIGPEGLLAKQYALVTNTSMFEHVRSRDVLDQIVSLVRDDGVFALHTWIGRKMPKDPEWFYLLPVHTTFWTKKAIDMMMRQWGFSTCFYNRDSDMWFFLRGSRGQIRQSALNRLRRPGWLFGTGEIPLWTEPLITRAYRKLNRIGASLTQ